MISKVTIRSALINILQIIVFSYKLFLITQKKNPNILALKFEYFSISLFLKRVLFKEINMF